MANTHSKIETLWSEFRTAINKTYKAAKPNAPAASLHDYAENVGWSDDLAKLLGRETANERQHRQSRTSPRGFSVGDAAKLILMNQAAEGSKLSEIPSATLFLTARQSAVEAQVIGWLCRKNLSDTWRETISTLDYAQLMKEQSRAGRSFADGMDEFDGGE